MRILNLVAFLGVVGVSGTHAIAQESLYGQSRAKHYVNSLAPYVVSPQEIVDRMLELADLKPGERLYDLGSGDGRVLITAVQRYHAKAVGIEISEVLAKMAADNVVRLCLQDQIQII